ALAFNFESTVAVMSDSAGQLLFYSNGCAVADRSHHIMPNGMGLNPGSLGDIVCERKGYIVPQGAMALPLPGQPGRYALLHLGAEYDPVRKLTLGPLYFSEIDLSQNGGLGDVTIKNEVLLSGDLGAFTAIRHGNGRDWWVLAPEFGGQMWHTFILSPAGFAAQPPQSLPATLPGCEKQGATAASPDGRRVATWGDCKLSIQHFDRCSGLLSGKIELAAPNHWIPGGGLAFSPSGRYLYATSQNVLFRVDLASAAPQLDTMRFSYDPFLKSKYDVPGNTFHFLQNGPDGKIYGNIPSRADYLHVINRPDGLNRDSIDFVPRRVKLPVTSVRTLPNVPNFRLGDLHGSPCDTLGITPVQEPLATAAFAVSVSPNPAHTEATLRDHSPQSVAQERRWRLYTPAGQVLRSGTLPPGQAEQRLDLSTLPAGLYLWELLRSDGGRVGGRVVRK
ncbi:MAG TPA: hypothetical protein PK858_04340, partial [Saprospiraceae bacterium]|nr:hypothetical protein [Saprospiraceae bacterium]